jgi:uncharacterized membrane protein YphA (DoxX/SURF4 family)
MTGLSTTNKIILGSLRYFIASVLLLSGLGKLLDVPGFVQVLITYQAIPAWGLHLVAVSLVLVELRISEWLFRDTTLVAGALGSLVLHSIFTIWTVVTLLRRVSVPNCGCFGVFFARPLSGWTVVEDLVLVIASFYLLRLALKRGDNHRAQGSSTGGELAPSNS